MTLSGPHVRTIKSMVGSWSGRRVTRERARLALTLPAPCVRCGRTVTPEMVWQVDHLVARAMGGGHDRANLGVAHVRCNTSAGSELGRQRRRARIRAAKGIKPW